jgi:hypothetical protein
LLPLLLRLLLLPPVALLMLHLLLLGLHVAVIECSSEE